MAAAAAAPGNAGKDEGGVVDTRRRMSRAELVKRWEDVFDNVGGEKAMELFMKLLLHDAQRSRKEQAEEEERRARVFEPWHPAPLGSAPPPVTAPPRVERSVVLGLRAPPHLLPRPKQERTTTPAADLGLSVKRAKKTPGGV